MKISCGVISRSPHHIQHTSYKSKDILQYNHNTIITPKKINNFLMSSKISSICKFPHLSSFYKNVFFLQLGKRSRQADILWGQNRVENWAHHNLLILEYFVQNQTLYIGFSYTASFLMRMLS